MLVGLPSSIIALSCDQCAHGLQPSLYKSLTNTFLSFSVPPMSLTFVMTILLMTPKPLLSVRANTQLGCLVSHDVTQGRVRSPSRSILRRRPNYIRNVPGIVLAMVGAILRTSLRLYPHLTTLSVSQCLWKIGWLNRYGKSSFQYFSSLN